MQAGLPPFSRVVALGGDERAIDAARSALRLGAREVTVIANGTRSRLLASDRDISEAQEIGDFASPLVQKGKADLFLSLERNEAYRTLSYVRPARGEEKGGLCFINAPENSFANNILACLHEQAVETYVFGADRLAREMGSIPSANIILKTCHLRYNFSGSIFRTSSST